MRILFTSLFLFIALLAHSQTKKIAFKSHSGNMNHFLQAIENDNGDTDNSNFGAAPEPIVRTAQLDSVILISDTAAIMITSEYCRDRRASNNNETKWKAGKDTVYRHALFNSHLSLDSIKSILRTQYYFKNQGKTVFIGFEVPITMNREREDMRVGLIPTNRNDHYINGGLGMTILIFGFLLLGGGFAWKVNNSRTRELVNP